jgi:hypothetical protein
MANEISASIGLTFVKGGVTASVNNGSFNDDVTGTRKLSTVQVLSTSEEAMQKGEITTPGWFHGKNLSTTAAEIIHVRQATGAANCISIPAGGEVMFKFASNTTAPFFIAASGTPSIAFTLIEA